MIRTPQTAGGTEVPMTEGETQQGGAPNYSLIVKGFIGLVVVLAIGFFLANSFLGNDAGESDQKIPEKIPEKKIDPVSGGIAGSGIIVGEEVSDDVSKKTPEEVGYMGKNYPIDNVPPILVPPDYELKNANGMLDGFQILDFRCENGIFKFCVKDSKMHRDDFRLKVVADDASIEHFSISTPKNKKVCYESPSVHPRLYTDPQEIQIRLFR